MDSDQGKLFVGGISWETTEETLREYFKHYGEIADVVIMRDRNTGSARGFGFVVFADPNVVDTVLQEKHVIAGRAVEAKKAVPRSEQQPHQQQQGSGRGSNPGPAQGFGQRTKKIFVGGLPATLTEDEFRKYFDQFGRITDVVVMYDSGTQRPRGFGFITFDSEEAVESVLQKNFHEIQGKLVEVKRAVPKDANAGGRGRGFGGFNSGGGGGGGGSGSYGRMDNRFGGTGRGYAGYGPSGYSAAPPPPPPVGFGAAGAGGYMNGGFGGGGYGYGSVPPAGPQSVPGGGGGYGGGPAVGGYGNGSIGAPRSPWSGAPGAGGGMAGYGNPPAYPYGDGGYNSGGGGRGAAVYGGGAPVAAYGGGYGGADPSGAYGVADPSGGYGGGDAMANEHAAYGVGPYGVAGRQNQKGPDSRFRPYPDRTG